MLLTVVIKGSIILLRILLSLILTSSVPRTGGPAKTTVRTGEAPSQALIGCYGVLKINNIIDCLTGLPIFFLTLLPIFLSLYFSMFFLIFFLVVVVVPFGRDSLKIS